MKTLTIFLKSNALFSVLTGASLLLFHQRIATFFAISSPTPFWILGIGLVLFAALVFQQSLQNPTNPTAVLVIILGDLLWVIGSGVLIATEAFNLSPNGYVTVGLVAPVIFIFALGQAIGLRKVRKQESTESKE